MKPKKDFAIGAISISLILVVGAVATFSVNEDELVVKVETDSGLNSDYKGFDDVTCKDSIENNGLIYKDNEDYSGSMTCYIDFKGEKKYYSVYGLQIPAISTLDKKPTQELIKQFKETQ